MLNIYTVLNRETQPGLKMNLNMNISKVDPCIFIPLYILAFMYVWIKDWDLKSKAVNGTMAT